MFHSFVWSVLLPQYSIQFGVHNEISLYYDDPMNAIIIMITMFFPLAIVALFPMIALAADPSALLDQYGNAVQFQHAWQAVAKQSSLVMVLHKKNYHDKSPEFWVVSLVDDDPAGSHLRQRRRLSREQNDPSSLFNSNNNTPNPTIHTMGRPYTGPKRFLHPLVSAFSHTFGSDEADEGDETTTITTTTASSSLAVVALGVQPDVTWLLQHVQEYATHVWERNHGHTTTSGLSRPGIVQAIVSLHRQCLAGWYGNNSGGPPLLTRWLQPPNNNEQEDRMAWSRPMGVCCVVLEANSMTRIDPSGATTTTTTNEDDDLICLGQGAEQVHEWWRQEQKKEQQSDNSNDNRDEDTQLLQTLCRGVAHLRQGSRLPRYLCVEVWSGGNENHDDDDKIRDPSGTTVVQPPQRSTRMTVQRRLIPVADYL